MVVILRIADEVIASGQVINLRAAARRIASFACHTVFHLISHAADFAVAAAHGGGRDTDQAGRRFLRGFADAPRCGHGVGAAVRPFARLGCDANGVIARIRGGVACDVHCGRIITNHGCGMLGAIVGVGSCDSDARLGGGGRRRRVLLEDSFDLHIAVRHGELVVGDYKPCRRYDLPLLEAVVLFGRCGQGDFRTSHGLVRRCGSRSVAVRADDLHMVPPVYSDCRRSLISRVVSCDHGIFRSRVIVAAIRRGETIGGAVLRHIGDGHGLDAGGRLSRCSRVAHGEGVRAGLSIEGILDGVAFAVRQSFHNMIKARIRPYFAPLGLQLREVTPQHIEDFYQSILADGCTTNTVIHYHAIIRKALQTAVKKDILLKNPADKVDRPKKNVFHGSFYSEEEMLTLFDAVSGDPLELCVKIAAYYGLRRSEVLGLRWSAIDMEHKTISISHKVIEAEVDGKFVPMGEDVLKTKSSFRTLPLIPAVGIILLEEKEKQEMYRRLFKKSYCRDYLDYICVDQCGKLLRPNYVTEHFSWLIEKYGLRKVRFHDLRHTCASLLLSNGISMKQIQIWLGHSTFSTTADIYAHLDYSAQEASANAMNGMFNRPEKEEQLA